MNRNDQSFARNAYSVPVTESPSFWRNISFAHELGHNMGAAHDRANSTQGLFPYSFGYQLTEAQPFFRDITAYQCANADCPTQPAPSASPPPIPAAPTPPKPSPSPLPRRHLRAHRPRSAHTFRTRRRRSLLGRHHHLRPLASRLPNLLDHGPLPVSGPGNATLNYQVAANGSGTPRRGSIQIGGVTHIIEQAFSISCTTAPIALAAAAPTALSASSCSSPLRGNTRAARYSFAGVASQQITLQLASTAFDAYLYSVRPDGTILAEDDGDGN